MEYEEIIEELVEEVETVQNGEETTEVSETVTQGDDFSQSGEILETVSDGDSILYDEQFADIIEELVYQREQMDSLQAYLEAKDMTIFEKPLEKYTVTEGLLLITFFAVLFALIMKIIGGIITCKV